MKERTNNILVSSVFALILFAGLAASVLLPDKDISLFERRKLAQLPQLDKAFSTTFESYAADQFPLRDTFRSLAAGSRLYMMGMRDSNGLYLAQGQIGKLEYPLHSGAAARALNKLAGITASFPPEARVYFAAIPDKNYYLAPKNGYPAMDYNALFSLVEESLPHAHIIRLTDCLGAEDYYRTDTHWRQENLAKVVDRLAEEMKLPKRFSDTTYASSALSPFYGVLYGQLALALPAEELTYLTSQTLSQTSVYNMETGLTGSVYSPSAEGRSDPYDLFLYGPSALLVMENPHADTDRELVLFRDSFGSSIAPLLMENYRRITLVDLRYLNSAYLEQFVTVADQDVLFLFSTLILNSGDVIK